MTDTASSSSNDPLANRSLLPGTCCQLPASSIRISLTSAIDVDQVLFEVISALATVGLSTGITAQLGPAHQLLLAVLMFIGRLGPLTLGTAMALRERQRLYRRPVGAPIIG